MKFDIRNILFVIAAAWVFLFFGNRALRAMGLSSYTTTGN